ncbi:HPP family protein [Paraburkholderia edwinii]|uniref:HPP family protein n=2 Tax=Paraburkholderia edwinii TaxID=2861782 RepID=A0ABX8UXG7_9BURK|nr:HPP family protein [Paraburkholderia edwinii]
MSSSLRRDRRGTFFDALIVGPVLSVVLLAIVAKAALLTGVIYVLFPELAALSYDVLKRPTGAWASSPVMLAITPAVTAAMGTAFTQAMPYGLMSVAMTIAGAILIVGWMRSPIVPAISAAFLPLVFGITSWWYPVSIAAVMASLALTSRPYGRLVTSGEVRQASAPNAGVPANDVPRVPWVRMWRSFFIFTAFLLMVYGLAAITRLRLILFPPLVVIAFEMFVHANVRPRPMRHLAVPFVCTITAGAGLAALLAFGAGPLSVVISMLVGILTLRALRLHFPPALTVGLLPQIMPHADWRFVLSVALGITALSGTVLLARPFLLNRSATLPAG